MPRALELLQESCTITGVSTFYRTAAIDRPEQDDYLNGVVAILYRGHPRALKHDVLRPIEDRLGRIRTGDAYAARTMDLDVVLCDMLVIEEPDLKIPAPDLWERPFLVAALMELVPDLVLPGTETPLKNLITEEQQSMLVSEEPFSRNLKERFINEY